jgi:hypothetical protein
MMLQHTQVEGIVNRPSEVQARMAKVMPRRLDGSGLRALFSGFSGTWQA